MTIQKTLSIYVPFLVIFLVAGCFRQEALQRETALDRVRSSRTLRCGYAEWPKFVERDPSTGVFSGMFADFMTELGSATDLKIEWAESVPFGDMPAALANGRVDAICSGVWVVAARAAAMTFTDPLSYSPGFAWIGAEDSEHTGLASLDNEKTRIAVIDGEFSQLIRGRVAPRAVEYAMPKATDGAELLLALSSKKADVTFTDMPGVIRFLRAHPGSIKRLPNSGPILSMPNAIALKKGEWELKELFDLVIAEFLANGVIDRIITKYEEHPDELLRVSPAWSEK